MQVYDDCYRCGQFCSYHVWGDGEYSADSQRTVPLTLEQMRRCDGCNQPRLDWPDGDDPYAVALANQQRQQWLDGGGKWLGSHPEAKRRALKKEERHEKLMARLRMWFPDGDQAREVGSINEARKLLQEVAKCAARGDRELMTDIVQRLRSARRGLCTEDPQDYLAKISVADAIEAADLIEQQAKRIAELEAELDRARSAMVDAIKQASP
jgi:hypothetical protein